MGIDPVTHKPRSETSGLLTSNSDGHYSTKSIANLSHIAQWESARLEAEARLVRESKLRDPSTLPIIHSPPPPPQHQHNKSAAMTTCFHDSHVTNMVTQQGEPCRSKSASGCSLRLGGGGGHIDLQSPTSTLSFSDTSMVWPIISMGFAHQNSTVLLCHDQAHLGNNEGLEVEQHLEFKCFDKPLIRLVSDNKDHRHRTMGGTGTGGLVPPQLAVGLPSMDTSNTAFGAEPWLIPESTSNCSTMRFSTGGDFGPPPPLPAASGGSLYTEMLLNSSHNAAGADDEEDSDLVVDVDHGGSCVEEEDDDDEDEDEGNNYWNNILDLVKLSPPSNSPPSPVF